jgi:hypothetical protein
MAGHTASVPLVALAAVNLVVLAATASIGRVSAHPRSVGMAAQRNGNCRGRRRAAGAPHRGNFGP